MSINKASGARITNFDGDYITRAEAMWKHPRIQGRYYVLSAARSRAHQWVLYAAMLAGIGNTAAKPGTSKHEYVSPPPPGARAMDVHPTSGKGGTYEELHAIAWLYGFHFPIPGEPWHMEQRPGRGPVPITKEEALMIAIEPVSSTSRPGGGGWVFGRRGHVYAFDGAPHFGGWAESDAGPTDRSGRDCVALVSSKSGQGYWLVSDAGEIYAYGDAVHPGNYQKKWGAGLIIGAFVNDLRPNGGVTLVRDDGQQLNLYRLPA